MKIIGDLNGTLTVQMSYAEFGDLTGREIDRSGNVRYPGNWYPIHQCVAFEFPIREGWNRLHLLDQNRPELQKVIRQLRAIADVLEPLESVVLPEPKAADGDESSEGGES